jgi:hypothetical protein
MQKAARWGLSFILGLACLGSSCGYHLRGNTRQFFEEKQIRKLYVAPVLNNSYKAGVEIMIYNALRKRFAQGGYVTIVDSVQEADAQIQAVVQTAMYLPFALTSVRDIGPGSAGPSNVQVASLYEASLSVQFELRDRNTQRLWGDTLLRSKRFAASTYYGAAGSTSALINESEFDRTLVDLSASVVTDAEETINTIF